MSTEVSRVLSQVGVRQVRPIPVVNPTGQKKRDFWSFYTPAIRRQAMLNYWPFMRRWGYAFPDEWGRPPASALAELKFATVDRGASLAALLGGLGPNSRVPWAVGVRDTIRRLWS